MSNELTTCSRECVHYFQRENGCLVPRLDGIFSNLADEAVKHPVGKVSPGDSCLYPINKSIPENDWDRNDTQDPRNATSDRHYWR